ncbi:hypothetical protein M422DRAFT_159636 [Sphaerobolus stellatus SS14]|nr:hypothetical protein M422DRAFT_159636 [Sphaerobolus stellatus SS14]
MPLSVFSLPLPQNGPPIGYSWKKTNVSAFSTTTAFNTGIDRRDIFLGERRCIVCGAEEDMAGLDHCHIIPQWKKLKQRHWIPQEAKENLRHEPRDGLLMCPNHHRSFDGYKFFIRYHHHSGKFIFINYSGTRLLEEFHGKAVALDINDRYAPFPSIFIIHEMRVRGFNPFQPITYDIPDTVPWQDWILSDGVFDEASNSFIRDLPPANNEPDLGGSPPQLQPTTSAGGGGNTLELNADVINTILAATRAMPSWKACQMEGTSWDGTAEENIQKYASVIGTQDVSSL